MYICSIVSLSLSVASSCFLDGRSFAWLRHTDASVDFGIHIIFHHAKSYVRAVRVAKSVYVRAVRDAQ